jgi:hypothetical protein
MPDPSVRARHVQQTLAAAEHTAAAAAVRRFVPSAVLAAIEAASGSDWLPVGHDVALVRVIHGALGPERYDAFARGVVLEELEGPLLGPMKRIVIAAVGRDAASWARLVPKAWGLIFSGCGEWTVVQADAGEAWLRIAPLPEACAAEPMWPTSLASSLSAVLAATGVAGTSSLERFEPTTRAATYALRWTPTPAA